MCLGLICTLFGSVPESVLLTDSAVAIVNIDLMQEVQLFLKNRWVSGA